MSNKIIYKYEVTDKKQFIAPDGAKALSLQIQRGKLCAWVELSNEGLKDFGDGRGLMGDLTTYWFEVRGTGQPYEKYPDFMEDFVGTIQDGALVWHVFLCRCTNPPKNL